jgi:WD40 repeat protein/serine/threonine protein kinase
MDAYLNRVIKGYELRERIGAGGFGAVYRAHQAAVGREVAIKIILPEYASQPDFIRRFEVEAQVIARLEHPHIVPLYDYWRDPEGAFLVMRLLRSSLRGAIQRGKWALDDVSQLLEQIGSALSVAHRENIVHRDVKPDNILLDEDNNAYLADFGIAKELGIDRTQEGTLIGSPAYITPEQIKGDAVSTKTDIYSLGLIVYELLLGEKPYVDATTPAELISRHLNTPLPKMRPRRPDLPATIDEVLQTATAKNPDHRYPNALRFAAAFRACVPNLQRGPSQPLPEPLTERELCILELLIDGLSNREIADKLVLTVGTVRWYINQIYTKLDVHSRHQAIERARQLKLSDVGDSPDIGTVEPPLERPILSMRITSRKLPELVNPYKGLRAFQEADASDFFGRASLTEQLLTRLNANDDGARFLAVVGPSGSGKSSAVKAGLIPTLRKGTLPTSSYWFITEMQPGTHPFEELEAALLRVSISPLPGLLSQLIEDRRGLTRAAKRILPTDPNSELLLVIDQFEELFTLTTDEETRLRFIDNLLAAVTDARGRVRVVLTLRADFYDRPLIYPRLAELMRSHTEVVVPMTVNELERAIVGPAERVGLALETGLVAQIVRDVGQQPGTLPLLQFSLSELYEHRADRQLTMNVYQESGGISGALARRADSLYEALDAPGQQTARQIFMRLVIPGEGTEDTRRRASQVELETLADTHIVDEVLSVFGEYRLLTFDRDPLTRGPTVEIAHEALIREWGQLREWLNTNREALRVHRRLLTAAQDWTSANMEASFLTSGAKLVQFEALAGESDVVLNALECEYLEASIKARQRHEDEEQSRQAHELELAKQATVSAQNAAQAQRQSANRLRYLAGILATAVLVTLILSVIAINNAAASSANLRRADSLRLAAEANRLLQTNDSVELTALLAVRSLRMGYSQQADSALQQAILLPQPIRIFASDGSTIGGAAFLPDGKTIFTAGNLPDTGDSVVRLWNVQTGQPLRTYTDISQRVADGAIFLARNGKAILANDKHTVWLYDLQTGNEIRHFEDNTRLVNYEDLSLDGKYLLRGDQDGTVTLFDVQSGVELRHFNGLANDAIRVMFSPDNRYVFTTPERTIVALWDLQSGQEIRRFIGHTDAVYPMGLSPDGKYLLTASNDSTARLWDIATGDEVRRFVGHTSLVWYAAYSPDGSMVLTGSVDRTVRLWDAATGKELYRFTGASGPLYGLGFSPDGKQFVTGGDGPLARLWAVPVQGSARVLVGHHGDVNSVTVSPDGAYFVTASSDGTSKVWDARTGTLVKTLTGKGTYGLPPIFSPDGKYLLTSNNARGDLWSLPDLKPLTSFDGLALGAVSPDMRRFASVDNSENNPRVHVGDLTGMAEAIAKGDLAPRPPLFTFKLVTDGWSIQYSPDSKTILVSGLDSIARLYDAENGQLLRQFTGHTDTVRAAVFSPDGQTVLTASGDKTARLWDVKTGKEIRQFLGHTAFLNGAVYSPDGRLVATASADGTVRLWNTSTGQLLRTLVGHTDIVFSVAFTPDGKRLITGSRDMTARIWEVDYHDLLDAACNVLVRDFTSEERTQFEIQEPGPTCPANSH